MKRQMLPIRILRSAGIALFACIFLPLTLITDSRKKGPEVELVTISPDGFDPQQITRPSGVFVLVVNNRSGLQEVQLRFDELKGKRLKDVRVRSNKLDWGDLIDLKAGTYSLTEANHPGWVCVFKITP